MSGNMVTISAERLKHLEELEAKIPAMINIVNKYNKTKDDKLRKLHERQKANPEEHNKKKLDKYHANKEEINAKRREAYKAKKEAEKAAAAAIPSE